MEIKKYTIAIKHSANLYPTKKFASDKSQPVWDTGGTKRQTRLLKQNTVHDSNTSYHWTCLTEQTPTHYDTLMHYSLPVLRQQGRDCLSLYWAMSGIHEAQR